MTRILALIIFLFPIYAFSKDHDFIEYRNAIEPLLDKHDQESIDLLSKIKPESKYYLESQTLKKRLICQDDTLECNVEGFRLNFHVSYLSTADLFLDRSNGKTIGKRMFWLNKAYKLAKRNFDIYTQRNTAYRIALLHYFVERFYDEDKVVEYYTIASDLGHLEATTNLGIFYLIKFQRDGGSEVLMRSKELLQKSCESNDPPACTALNMINSI